MILALISTPKLMLYSIVECFHALPVHQRTHQASKPNRLYLPAWRSVNMPASPVFVPGSNRHCESDFDNSAYEILSSDDNRMGTISTQRSANTDNQEDTMQQKTVIIVSGSDKEVKAAAHHLYNLIGALGELKASIWDEKAYKSNEPTIPSSQPLIFIGETETSRLMIDSIKWSYDNLNMRYGWIGRRAVVYVKADSLTLKDYEKFKSMFDLQENSINDGNFFSKVKSFDKRLTTLDTKAKICGLFLPYLWPVAAYSLIKGHIDDKKIIKQQYSYVVNNFFSESLGGFLGE
jgi:hypothetical protein